MIIERTKYTIETKKDTFKVFKSGKLEAIGIGREEEALKTVHVLEGSVKDDFYTEIDGIVLLNTPVKFNKA